VIERRIAEIVATLPGKDCGQCGFKTCAGLAELILHEPRARRRCVHLGTGGEAVPQAQDTREAMWRDLLGREYQMVLEPFPEDPGPREHILPFNPMLAERLGLKRGDILFGRPAGVGCPVTHVGRLMEPPDALSGELVWCVVGPLAARQAPSAEIGNYHIIAYEGLVREARLAPQVGGRYFFKPALCMLQSRHSGVVSAATRRPDGWRVRFEGIAIA
jgi:uncharacterized Fe-S cluster-containing protein